MITLTVAAILVMLLTLLMWAAEQYERMRQAAREQAREEIRRRDHERIVADMVEELHEDLDRLAADRGRHRD